MMHIWDGLSSDIRSGDFDAQTQKQGLLSHTTEKF